ncbi:PRKR-interacting protein 1 homolog [Chiloscyllium punctatum]|uniref:PRKR-interacting protein 1 homolog n=1 Tax=Chiloscyllium punctatum TaxID=137246 RepID=UPI003B634617
MGELRSGLSVELKVKSPDVETVAPSCRGKARVVDEHKHRAVVRVRGPGWAAMADRAKRPNKKLLQPLVIPRNAAEEQRLKLERLMKNPEKQVPILEKPKDWAPRPPPEFVRDVMGSSAGAGSGEFHVYRHLRRREYMREEFMEKQAAQQHLEEEFQKKLDSNRKVAEEKTEKRRKKRQKLKEKKLLAKKAKQDSTKTTEGSENSSSEEEENSPNNKVDDCEDPSFVMGGR